jgi:hypothetical protein
MPAGVTVLPLGDDTFYREIGLVQRDSRSLQSATLQFAECVCEAAGSQPAELLSHEQLPIT